MLFDLSQKSTDNNAFKSIRAGKADSSSENRQ